MHTTRFANPLQLFLMNSDSRKLTKYLDQFKRRIWAKNPHSSGYKAAGFQYYEGGSLLETWRVCSDCYYLSDDSRWLTYLMGEVDYDEATQFAEPLARFYVILGVHRESNIDESSKKRLDDRCSSVHTTKPPTMVSCVTTT
jgi:hypothetical protein